METSHAVYQLTVVWVVSTVRKSKIDRLLMISIAYYSYLSRNTKPPAVWPLDGFVEP
jgi:hypothetical protein